MTRNPLLRTSLAFIVIIQLANLLSAQQTCGGANGSLDADVQITGGDSKNYRHCYYTVNVSNFFCPFGTILSPDCRNAGHYGVGWFGLALSVVASADYHCGAVYFSEVTKELTFKAAGAAPNADYDLKVEWSEAANSVAPARTWSSTYRVRSSTTGNLTYTMQATAGRSSHGQVVSSEHQIEQAKFDPVGSSGDSSALTINYPTPTTSGCQYFLSAGIDGGSVGYSFRWRTTESNWTNWSPQPLLHLVFSTSGSHWVEVQAQQEGSDCILNKRISILVHSPVEKQVLSQIDTQTDWRQVSPAVLCNIPTNLPPGTPPQYCTLYFTAINSITENLGIILNTGPISASLLQSPPASTIASPVGSGATTQGQPQKAYALFARALLTKESGSYNWYDCTSHRGSGTYAIDKIRTNMTPNTCWVFTARETSFL